MIKSKELMGSIRMQERSKTSFCDKQLAEYVMHAMMSVATKKYVTVLYSWFKCAPNMFKFLKPHTLLALCDQTGWI